MEGFPSKNNIIEDTSSMRTLLQYPKYFNKCSADMERLLLQVKEERRQLSSYISRLERDYKTLERKNDELQYYSRDCRRLRRERDEAREYIRNFDRLENVRNLESQVNDLSQLLRQTLTEKDAELRKAQRNFQEIISRKDRIIQNLEEKIRQRDLKVQHLESRLSNEKSRSREESSSRKALHDEDHYISDLRKQLQETFVKLRETQAELDETKTRLSKVMGDRLMDNNPNVADLSDKNRPTKLAERYAELYDNQWTEAFEVLVKFFQTEERTIEVLVEILKDVMAFCKRTAKAQMEEFQRVMALSEQVVDGKTPNSVMKKLKDCRKEMSSLAFANLQQIYLSNLQRSNKQSLRTALDVIPFVKECLEICWLMEIQDPPVVFAPLAAQDSVLNTNLYKPYTRSGTHVDFLVWPALLLYEGGPVLAKGVVQGYKKQTGETILPQINTGRLGNENPRARNEDALLRRYGSDDTNNIQLNRKNSNMFYADKQQHLRVAAVGPMQMTR